MSNCTPQSLGENNPSIPLPDGMNCCTKIPEGASDAEWEAAGEEFADKYIQHCVHPTSSEPWNPNMGCNVDNECMRKFVPWYANCLNTTAQDTSYLLPPDIDQRKIDLYMRTINNRLASEGVKDHVLDSDVTPYPDLHEITDCVNVLYNNSCRTGPNNQPCQNGGQVSGDTENGCICQCPTGYTGEYCEEKAKPWRLHPDVARVNPDEVVRDCGTVFPTEVSPDECARFFKNSSGIRPHANRYNTCSQYFGNPRLCRRNTPDAECCRGLLAEYDYNCSDVDWVIDGPPSEIRETGLAPNQVALNRIVRDWKRNCNL